MLVDTDILIDYLRSRVEAAAFIERNVDDISISSMTVAELYQGVRDGDEMLALNSLVSVFTVLPITEVIAIQAGLFRRDYKKSHGSGLADCFIAATAQVHELDLKTLNTKHYPMISRAEKPY